MFFEDLPAGVQDAFRDLRPSEITTVRYRPKTPMRMDWDDDRVPLLAETSNGEGPLNYGRIVRQNGHSSDASRVLFEGKGIEAFPDEIAFHEITEDDLNLDDTHDPANRHWTFYPYHRLILWAAHPETFELLVREGLVQKRLSRPAVEHITKKKKRLFCYIVDFPAAPIIDYERQECNWTINTNPVFLKRSDRPFLYVPDPVFYFTPGCFLEPSDAPPIARDQGARNCIFITRTALRRLRDAGIHGPSYDAI